MKSVEKIAMRRRSRVPVMSRILWTKILTAPSTQDIDSYYDHHVSCILPAPTTTHGETCRAGARRVLFVPCAVLMFWSVDVVLLKL